jgi:hypothetical protein
MLQIENNCLFTIYTEQIIVTKHKMVMEMTANYVHPRHLKFQAILPNSVRSATDNDLRLSLVSLKNAKSAIAVHAMRIEQELSSRKVSKYIIHQERDT